MPHTVKLFERIINHMLRTIVELGNIHFVFRRGRSIMDPALRTLTHPSGISVIGMVLHINSMEKCRNCNTNAGSIVDRPLLNTKWMLPNSTIVLSMWFIIRSNCSDTVWDISFILQKLLHSSMIPGVSSLNLHEYAMADVSTASISFSRHTITCSLVFFNTSIGIRSDHMSYPTSSYPAAF